MDNTHNDYSNMWLSIVMSAGSLVSLMMAHLTTYNIAWAIGTVSGIVAIYAGVLAIKERRLNIQLLKQKINESKK